MPEDHLKRHLPKEKSPLDSLAGEDMEKFMALHGPLLDQIDKAKRRRAYSEAFLLAWAFLEQLLLPMLIREIARRLRLKKVPKLDERTHITQLISYYYFLSQDLTLYEELLRANDFRRKLVHRLQTSEDIVQVNKNAKVATDHIEGPILSILERLAGHKSVPVLSLYTRGWNDFRAEALKRFKRVG